MALGVRADVLIGRDQELGLLRVALDALPEAGTAILLRGEAGIGKSELLDAVRDDALARGCRVLYTAGVTLESEVAFAGLHRLLRPVTAKLELLIPTQRSALQAAFGVDGDEAPDPFLVAMATLELVSVEAGTQPLVILADDLHWLDTPSLEVLTFVARRLESDPIVLVGALRDGYDDAIGELGVPQRALKRLSNDEASALLDARAPDLPQQARERVLIEAAGNPLALVELPDTTAGAAHAAPLPLSARLEQAFAARVRDMPQPTAELLLVAACDESLTQAEALAAAAQLVDADVSLSKLQPAVDARLIRVVDTGVQFRHPLVRSATYQAAPLEGRIAAHAALAEVLTNQPDRRALHLAAATLGRDEHVAAELEGMATRALHRGAALQSAFSLARAAELSEEPEDKARRLLEAGALAFQVGRADLVRHYVGEARRLNLSNLDRARAEWLTEIFYDGLPGDSARVRTLIANAKRAHQEDEDELAFTLLHAAGRRSWWADPGEDVRSEVIAAAMEVKDDLVDPVMLNIVALAQPVSMSGEVMRATRRLPAAVFDDPEAALRVGEAAHAIGDFETSLRVLRAVTETLRAHGRLGLLTHAVGMLASSAVFACDWTLADGASVEFTQLADETNQPIWRAGAAIARAAVAGVHGDAEQAEVWAAEAERLLGSEENSNLLCVLLNARGTAALASGDYEAAYAHLARMFDPNDAGYHHRERFVGAANFADAALRTGREIQARAIIEQLMHEGHVDAHRGLVLGPHYARAVLATDAQAEEAFAAAADSMIARWPFNRARLQLAYGAWLRRQRRVRESREPLQAAISTFDQLGIRPWGNRAREELRAAGLSSRSRAPEAWDALSAQELQIGKLAATGLSNREIGQRLYLSHRTVASHLYRMFPKLGISSRAQLSTVLPERSEDDLAGA